ncbi:hypothetical protein Q3G72_026926 [Acer saccharum]|nr:hypothetical protein Q3G72_026926 [Acer saccharum]
MRECTEDGEERDVTFEANLRLNVWLRTVSPLKRFHQRPGRADQRTWNKQAGTLASLSGNFRPRRAADHWKGKESSVVDMDSGDRWRKVCHSTNTKKAVSSIDPKQQCMGTDNAFNVVDKENRSGELISDEVTSHVGEKQNESLQPQVGSFQQYGPDILGAPIERCGPVMSVTKDGLFNISPNKLTFGAKKTHKSTNWKRIARGGQNTEADSELVKEKVRSTKIGGKSEEESQEKIEVHDKVRKREEVLEVDDASFNRKKNKHRSPMETEIAKKEDEATVSEGAGKLSSVQHPPVSQAGIKGEGDVSNGD